MLAQGEFPGDDKLGEEDIPLWLGPLVGAYQFFKEGGHAPTDALYGSKKSGIEAYSGIRGYWPQNKPKAAEGLGQV